MMKQKQSYTVSYTHLHAPPSFSDRSILWNSVEQIEKSNNSQLAREIEIALPVELSREAVSYTHLYLKSKNAKKYRHGMEYGSARCGA